MITDSQAKSGLRSSYRTDITFTTKSTEAILPLFGLSGAMILPAERARLWFNVQRTPRGCPEGLYSIRPILELKSSKPRGEFEFGTAPLRPSFLKLGEDGWGDLGLLVAEKRSRILDPLDGSVLDLIEFMKDEPSCLMKSPSFGPRIEEALTEDGDGLSETAITGQALLGVNTLLEEVGDSVSVQIPLPEIGSDYIEGILEEGELPDRTAREAILWRVLKSSQPSLQKALGYIVDLDLGLLIKALFKGLLGLPFITDALDSFLTEGWSRKRTKGYNIRGDANSFLQLEPIFKEAYGRPMETVVQDVSKAVERIYLMNEGGAPSVSRDPINRAPRRKDGSPFWEDRLMVPFFFENASVVWKGEPRPSRSKEGGLSFSMVLSSDRIDLSAPSSEETAPSDSAPSSEETAPSDSAPISEETAPSDSAPISEETAPSDSAPISEETAPSPLSFPSMESWRDLLKV